MTNIQIINALVKDEVSKTVDKDAEGFFAFLPNGDKFYFTMKQLDAALLKYSMNKIRNMSSEEKKELLEML